MHWPLRCHHGLLHELVDLLQRELTGVDWLIHICIPGAQLSQGQSIRVEGALMHYVPVAESTLILTPPCPHCTEVNNTASLWLYQADLAM